MTDTDLIKSYIGSLYGYSPLTIKIHENSLMLDRNCFLSYLEQLHVGVVETTIQIVEEYKARLLQTMSPRSVNKYLCTLRKFFKFLRLQGYVKTNPALEVELPVKSSGKEFTVLQPEVVEVFLKEDFGCNQYSTARDRFVICLFLRCGLHPHEVSKLMMSDLIGDRNLRVVGRRNRFKVIELDAFTGAVLDEYLKFRNAYLVWRGAEDAKNLICASCPRYGSYRISTYGLAAIVSRACKMLRRKYGYDVRKVNSITMAHTARFFNWIVMESSAVEKEGMPEFDGSMGHALRRKITEYNPLTQPSFNNEGLNI